MRMRWPIVLAVLGLACGGGPPRASAPAASRPTAPPPSAARAEVEAKVGLALPARGVYVVTNGMVGGTFRAVVDLDAGTLDFYASDEARAWRVALGADDLRALAGLADGVWRDGSSTPIGPGTEYYEVVALVDGDRATYLEAGDGFREDPPSRLVQKVQSLGLSTRPPPPASADEAIASFRAVWRLVVMANVPGGEQELIGLIDEEIRAGRGRWEATRGSCRAQHDRVAAGSSHHPPLVFFGLLERMDRDGECWAVLYDGGMKRVVEGFLAAGDGRVLVVWRVPEG